MATHDVCWVCHKPIREEPDYIKLDKFSVPVHWACSEKLKPAKSTKEAAK